MALDLFRTGYLTPQLQSVSNSRLGITQLAGQRCLVRRDMEIFYWFAGAIFLVTLFTWVVNELPMELPEDDDADDWTRQW